MDNVEGDDVADFLTDVFSELSAPMLDVDRDQMLKVSRHDRDDRLCIGVVQSGDYGYETDLVNTETMDVSYRRQHEDAELRPFFFLFSVPSGTDEGVVLLQRSGPLGVRGPLIGALSSRFKQRHPDHRLMVNPLESGEALADILQNGEMKAIRFVRFELPTDLADQYSRTWNHEGEAEAEIVFRAHRNKSIPVIDRIMEFARGTRALTDIVEIQNFDYNDIKVEVVLGGHRRVIDLRRPLGASSFDITGDVQLGVDGHPDYGSISRIAKDIAADIRKAVGA